MSVVVDPPMGWRFGFPAKYDGDLGDKKALEAFCLKRGYPQELIDLGMLKHCRWWDYKEKTDDESGDQGETEGVSVEGLDKPGGDGGGPSLRGGTDPVAEGEDK